MPKEELPQAEDGSTPALVASKSTTTGMPPPSSRQEITISGRLNDIGVGCYQVQVCILAAGFVFAEISVISMFSGTVSAISTEYQLFSTSSQSMLTTCTFIGMCFGTVASGPLGDTFGRRCPLLIAYLGIVCCSVALSLAEALWCIYALRAACGCFAGLGLPTALITISEVMPTDSRAICMAAVGFAWCFGDMTAALILNIEMPDLITGNWRISTLFSAIPAACLLIFSAFSPVSRVDTPHFLASKRRAGEALRALGLVAELNRMPALKPTGLEVLVVESPEKCLTFVQACPLILKPPMLTSTVVLAVIQVTKDFGLYGMNVFWPLAWALVDLPGAMDSSTELLFTALTALPGVGLSMYIMSRGHRRHTLFAAAISCAAAYFILHALLKSQQVGLLGVCVHKLVFPTQQMITLLYPSEIYPTPVRCWGFSVVAAFGRLGCILAPTMVIYSPTFFLNSGAILSIASAACVLLLPETKDCDLPELRKYCDPPSEYRTFDAPTKGP